MPIFFETLLQMLTGMVDTVMISSVGDQAVGAVGGTWLFGVHMGLMALGAYIGLASGECVRAVCMILRWRSGHWRTKRLVSDGERAA